MTPFLKQVATHCLDQGRLDSSCFILPNRRSLVFFKKYLGQGVGKTTLVPRMYTIHDFLCKVHGREVSGRVPLLLRLYDCYTALYPGAEPLDEFIFWGDVLLADFNDIDKYLVNARNLLQNVAELKGMQDSFDYLSERQREAIGNFLSHFREGGKLNVKPGSVKDRFLKTWNILYPLYRDFNEVLSREGMCYEGQVYRALAEKLKEGVPVADILGPVFPGVESFHFVGLNALNLCEHMILSKMRDAGVARFYWDFSSAEIRDKANCASRFMRENLRDFPQEFEPDPEGCTLPRIQVISVPSATGQAKMAGQLAADFDGDPVESAIVLPDESLLLPLLNSIPPSRDKINVTMGYPMKESAVYTLVKAIFGLQLSLREKDGKWYFYHRGVQAVISSGLLPQLLDGNESEVIARIKADAKYYIPADELRGGPLLERIFVPVLRQSAEASAAQNHQLESYLRDLLLYLGSRLSPDGDNLLELDFIKRCHTVIGSLSDVDLPILPATWLRIADSLLLGVSVPFRGEPLEGLQIMGPLETRALDFRNPIILSANEGMFPRHSYTPSFIPPELRRSFGLPGFEYQDAVWAYYFYRLLQRASRVILIYDSRTEGLNSGEESRYIKQLEYHFGIKVEKMVAVAPLQPVPDLPDIEKSPEDIERIKAMKLSPTAIQAYLSCPAKFCYKHIKGLKADQEVAESLDSSMLGNVFHAVIQELYTPFTGKALLEADIEKMLADRKGIRSRIRRNILLQMKSIEVSGRNLVLENILEDYIRHTLEHDKRLASAAGSYGLRIIGLERDLEADFHGFHLWGRADRIDSCRPGQLRVVDYKTGQVKDEDIRLDPKSVQALFGDKEARRPKIALQLYLYDYMAKATPGLTRADIVNSIYSTARLYAGGIEEIAPSPEVSAMMEEQVEALLQEMVNPQLPFRRSADADSCKYCDFKTICGR